MIINFDSINFKNYKSNIINEKKINNELKENPFGKYLLYIENNEVIGYLYYSEIYERVEINQIEIEIKYRNCGKGTNLLNKLINEVNKDITLEVKIDNYPAISLYNKFKFKKVAIRKKYYNGVDGILMERKKDSL